mgnify:CR=1 FL=1
MRNLPRKGGGVTKATGKSPEPKTRRQQAKKEEVQAPKSPRREEPVIPKTHQDVQKEARAEEMRERSSQEGESRKNLDGNRGGGNIQTKESHSQECDYSNEFVALTAQLSSQLSGDKLSSLKRNACYESISNMQKHFNNILLDNQRLRAENNVLRSTPLPKAISYASIAATPKPVARQQLVQETSKKVRHTVFLSAEGKDGKAVQKTLTTKLDPAKHKIKIRNIRTTAKAVVLEVDSKEDCEKLLQNESIKEAKIVAELPRKRNPLMIVYDTPVSAKLEDLKTQIFTQNFEGAIPQEEFDNGFNFRFRTGPRDRATVHQVVEVSARIRHAIISKGRLFAGFSSHPVKDYVVVAKCHKCQDLGHVAKWCKAEKAVCAHCGEQDHTKQECQKSKLAAVCIPCKNRNKRCSVSRADCPTHKLLFERLIERTDYGNAQ